MMKSDEFVLNLNSHNFRTWLRDSDGNSQNNIPQKEPNVFRVMFTKTLIPLYNMLMFMVVIVF